MERRKKLVNLIRDKGIVVAPGCHDALGAKIIEAAGFDVVYMTGNGVSAVNLPVICDSDTGYGNVNNVIRTVEEYEAAAVSGIHIEDQITPQKVRRHGRAETRVA